MGFAKNLRGQDTLYKFTIDVYMNRVKSVKHEALHNDRLVLKCDYEGNQCTKINFAYKGDTVIQNITQLQLKYIYQNSQYCFVKPSDTKNHLIKANAPIPCPALTGNWSLAQFDLQSICDCIFDTVSNYRYIEILNKRSQLEYAYEIHKQDSIAFKEARRYIEDSTDSMNFGKLYFREVPGLFNYYKFDSLGRKILDSTNFYTINISSSIDYQYQGDTTFVYSNNNGIRSITEIQIADEEAGVRRFNINENDHSTLIQSSNNGLDSKTVECMQGKEWRTTEWIFEKHENEEVRTELINGITWRKIITRFGVKPCSKH